MTQILHLHGFRPPIEYLHSNICWEYPFLTSLSSQQHLSVSLKYDVITLEEVEMSIVGGWRDEVNGLFRVEEVGVLGECCPILRVLG